MRIEITKNILFRETVNLNVIIYYLTQIGFDSQNLTPAPSPMERGEKMVQCSPLHRRGVGGEVLRQIVDGSEFKCTVFDLEELPESRNNFREV